ncbi:MAG TPA: isochorismatase family cysteine hydrolase [Candidatus Acidoferrales bacterium]|nr:isochorismatase family cysteine hydrolase [Candidatus Acidoferrales bacterium]
MISVQHDSPVVLWEVDTQADFMLPGGKLYVPSAEKRIPNMRRLVESARSREALFFSSTDQHSPNDPEFQRFPPHCVQGTSGAEIIPELKASNTVHVKNTSPATLPATIAGGTQIVIEKQTLDVFDNPFTEKLLAQIPSDAEFIVFGVVTEFCVRLAAKGLLDRGRRVAIVTDAIETLDPNEGKKTLDELASRGAQLITADDAVKILERFPAPA